MGEVTREGLAEFFARVVPLLDERQKRLVLGAAAELLARGGRTAVADAAGVSRNTVITGAQEVTGEEGGRSARVRRTGGGRPKAIDKNPDLLLELDDLVHPETRGDPMSPLKWPLKSTTQLAVITSLSTVLQQDLDDKVRGKVLALWIMSFGGVVPFGGLLGGALMARGRATRR